MKRGTLFSTFSAAIIAAIILISCAGCTPKHITNNTGDAKVYNDDSEITMKATEKNSKMPFDTTSAPVQKRP